VVKQQREMIDKQPRVFVVDDNAMIREALVGLLESEGIEVQAYPSANDFIDAYQADSPGCLLLDIDMPGIDGLKLQDLLAEMHLRIPIIFLTGLGSVPKTIQAFRKGAFDLLEKPPSAEMLLERIKEALAKDTREHVEEMRRCSVQECLARLTPREREVMALMVSGYSSKQMAKELIISFRTVEGHRRRIYAKLGAESIADLIEMARVTGLLKRNNVS
jgi:FixJ family two-component response regulator